MRKVRYISFIFITERIAVFLVLVLWIWGVILIFQRPDVGAVWSFTSGMVTQISPGGPSRGILQLGDTIITLDGLPVRDARGYPGRRTGDMIHLLVERNHQRIKLDIRLSKAEPLVLLDRLTPMVIALAFWVLGALAFWFDHSRTRWVATAYGMAAAATLTLGSLSFFGPVWTSYLFDFLLWWAGPLAVHAHLRIFHRQSGKPLTYLTYALYSLALPLSLSGVVFRLAAIGPGDNVMQTLTYLWLGIDFLLALGVTIFQNRAGSRQKEPRYRLGVMGLLVTAGIFPLFILTLLPDTLFGSALLPYDLAFIFIILIPMGYAMVLFEDRLASVSRSINRTVVFGLVLLVIAAIYMLVYYGVLKIFQTQDRAFVFSGLIVTLGLVAAAYPLFRWVSDLGEILLYGEAYNYQAALHAIENTLAKAGTTSQSVADILCRSIVRILIAEYTGLLLWDGTLLLYQADNPGGCATWKLSEASAQAILAQKKPNTSIFTKGEMGIPEDPASRWSALLRKAALAIPLQGRHGCIAVLLVGPRRGFHSYDRPALDILESITYQAQIAIENTYLLAEAQEQAAQAAEMHRRVVRAREDERKRIARDLHDRTIQALVGLNFQLEELGFSQSAPILEKINQLQGEIRSLSQDLRQVCADLRPPALDTVGLLPAIQSRVAGLNQLNPDWVTFQARGDFGQEIPEETAICLYRVFQEAILNVQKHSGASHVSVSLVIEAEQLHLTISDNGRGFTVPDQLGELAKDYHFGLMGLREMLGATGGSLSIQSSPGKSCTIHATACLSAPDSAKRTTDIGEKV